MMFLVKVTSLLMLGIEYLENIVVRNNVLLVTYFFVQSAKRYLTALESVPKRLENHSTKPEWKQL